MASLTAGERSTNGMLAYPLVSIVTVTFNSSATIIDTLNSVRAQRYPSVEHVIVDGGSTDVTASLVAAAASEYGGIVWLSEPDDGIYDAMNKGIRMATGDIIGVLNSDDFFIDDEVVSDIVDHFIMTSCDVLYADLVFVDWFDTSQIKRVWIAGRGRVQCGWNPPHPTCYMTKDVYRRFGFYKTEYKISSDYDYILRILCQNSGVKTSYLERVIVKMRHGGVSTRNLDGNRVAFREAQQSLSEQGFSLPLVVNMMRVFRKMTQLRPWVKVRYSLPGRRK